MSLAGCGVVFFSLFQTDTASVLLEAIGYIRFLQSQIQVMSLLSFLFAYMYTIIKVVSFHNVAFLLLKYFPSFPPLNTGSQPTVLR